MKPIQYKRLGIMYICGGGLPDSGVVFLAPIKKNGFIYGVHQAINICDKKFPRFNGKRKVSKWEGRNAYGDCSETEEKDWNWFTTSKVWAGNKFIWDSDLQDFKPFDKESEY